METMERHPTAFDDASGSPEAQDVGPYRVFFDAIADLKDTVLLHGAQSFEAGIARKRVERTREEAIAAWRQERPAA